MRVRALIAALLFALCSAIPARAAADPCPGLATGLACAASRLLDVTLPFEAPSPDTVFARLTYTDTPGAADGRLGTVVVQAGTPGPAYVRALHASSPGLTVLAYQSLWLRPTGDPGGETTCLAGSGSYPASWYLRGDASAPERIGADGDLEAMDFANPAYLRACAAHAIATAQSLGADGVFLDGAATSVRWAQLRAPCVTGSGTCASDAAWQRAMTEALRYLAGALHRHGLLLYANISGGEVDSCCGGGPAVWRRYLGLLDGAMQESWTYGTDGRPLNAHQVALGLANVAWDEAEGKATLVNDDVAGCAPCIGLGLAAELLVADGRTSYDVSAGAYGPDPTWWPIYERAQRLGRPTGAYVTASDGLLVRRFTGGLVAVNDTAASISDPSLGLVPAHTGIVRSSS